MRVSALVLSVALGSLIGLAQAQSSDEGVVSFGKRIPTLDEVSKALSADSAAAASTAPMGVESGVRTRGIAMGGASSTLAGAKVKAMDMDVQFAFGSDALSGRAKQQLAPLGNFLKTAKLDANVVVIEGHTDSLGSADFATDLSIRRAQSIRDFLVAEYKLDNSNFVTLGRGKQQPKDVNNVANEANRRIQFYVRPK
jgi:outer membrane protein OmpA-like peptidoglycan-associated protein